MVTFGLALKDRARFDSETRRSLTISVSLERQAACDPTMFTRRLLTERASYGLEQVAESVATNRIARAARTSRKIVRPISFARSFAERTANSCAARTAGCSLMMRRNLHGGLIHSFKARRASLLPKAMVDDVSLVDPQGLILTLNPG